MTPTGKRQMSHRIISPLYRCFGRLRRMWSIVQTPYWRSVCDDCLNYASMQSPPEMRLISQERNMRLLEIGGLRLYWPNEFSEKHILALYQETFRAASHNPHAYEYGQIRIKPGDWVVDAGACEGFFTHLALMRGANVVIIEPVAMLATALRLTFASDINAGRVTVIEAGLGEKTEVTRFSVNHESVLMSRVDALAGAETIQLTSLDELLEKGVMPRIDFIKMDIEGFEIAAIKGAARLLREHSPILSLAVYHEFDNAAIIRKFVSCVQPRYHLRYRGVLLRKDFGKPRPYMLYGHV